MHAQQIWILQISTKLQQKKHYSEVCQESKAFKTIETCPKRHPKRCEEVNSENGCNFESDCAYPHEINKNTIKPSETDAKIDLHENIVIEMASKVLNHKDVTSNTEDTEVKEKVNLLEAVVKKMFLNVIKLEAEVKELKTKTTNVIKETDVRDNLLPGKQNEEKVVHSKPINIMDKKDMGKTNYALKCDMCKNS